MDIAQSHALYALLMQVMFQAKHQMLQIAEQHGLTLMQSNALMMLKPASPIPMNALSAIFMCDASNVTGITDRLESQGLVTRGDHATDRRIKMVVLTDKGVTLKQQLLDEVIAAEGERLGPILSDAERHILTQLLEKILQDN